MTWLILLLLPVLLLMFAVQVFIAQQFWRTRHERPRFRDLRRQEQIAAVGTVGSGLGLAALISLGYGEIGAKVLLVVVGAVAVLIVALVPWTIWVDRRGSPELQHRLLGRPPGP